MTSTITVQSHNLPVQVETFDNGVLTDSKVLLPEDGEVKFYCTTTREVRVTDLEYDDPAAVERIKSIVDAPVTDPSPATA